MLGIFPVSQVHLKDRHKESHHGGFHQKRQGPGWLSSRSSASILTELPAGGYTAYLQWHSDVLLMESNLENYLFFANLQTIPARGVLAVLLCVRWSASGLEPEDVDGPGLLSMATSDTVRKHNGGNEPESQVIFLTYRQTTDQNLSLAQ